MKSGSFFVLWPYFALTMLVAGTLIRYVATARRPSTVRDEVSEAWAIFRGSWLWRVSLVILLAAHLAALVMPQAILRWNNVGTRLYLMEGLLFLAGSAAVVSGAVLVWK